MAKTFFTIIAIALLTTSASAETRCGWISNPTPGNWSLIDADQEWVLASQGSAGVDGMDLIPDLTERDWVITNAGSYGYGCACMSVVTDNGDVLRIKSFQQLPLKKCQADDNLPDFLERG